jgi:guanylate kinase
VTLNLKQKTKKNQGRFFIISGPSGVGKGTLVSAAVEALPQLALSVSATTRAPRPGDEEGVSYHFKSDAEFDELVKHGGLLEWAEVHGRRYGTLSSEVRAALDEGRDLILEIDPQGCEQIKAQLPEAVAIFIAPPSLAELKKRLEGRATEDAASIERRLRTAEVEMGMQNRYNVVIVNDNQHEATQSLLEVISAGLSEQAPADGDPGDAS